MVPNRVAVLADKRWLLQVLGRTAALLVALVCASIFANTARADDLAPTDPSGTPSSSAPAPDADTPDAPDTDAADTDATSTVGLAPRSQYLCPGARPDLDRYGCHCDHYSARHDPEAPGCTSTPSDPTPTGTDATATTAAPGTDPEARDAPPAFRSCLGRHGSQRDHSLPGYRTRASETLRRRRHWRYL